MPATQRTAAQSPHRAHEPGPHGCFWPWRSGERAEKPTKANTRVHTRTAPPRRAPLPAPPVHADAPCSPFHPPALPQPPPPVSTVDPSFLPLGPHTRSLLTVHQMSAGQQIRGSGWQWRVGTGEQSSRLMLGWGVVAEGVQDGRKCRIPMAACLHGRKCQHSTAGCVCCCPCSTILILVQASLGWCTPMLGCLHRLVCLYQIKLKSNQIKCYIRSQKLILRHVTRATTTHQLQKMRTNRPHDVAHASVPVIPSRERVDAAPVCSSSTNARRYGEPRLSTPLWGGGGGRSQGGVAWGSPRAGPPMGREGGVRCARSGICMLPAHYVQRRTPCLLPVVVSPFVGARHVANIAHAAAAGPRPAGLCTSGAWA
jgi:hypothetical protein